MLTGCRCAIGSAFEARYHPTFITFPKSLAEFFADRAKALLEIELDSPCVATVQALVIMSCHEGASNRDARGWLYSGKYTSWRWGTINAHCLIALQECLCGLLLILVYT
jgi:hypothetical protein